MPDPASPDQIAAAYDRAERTNAALANLNGLRDADPDADHTRDLDGFDILSLIGTAPAVCARCLDVDPGHPSGDPDRPHPGPFLPELCGACERATRPGRVLHGAGAYSRRQRIPLITTLEVA